MLLLFLSLSFPVVLDSCGVSDFIRHDLKGTQYIWRHITLREINKLVCSALTLWWPLVVCVHGILRKPGILILLRSFERPNHCFVCFVLSPEDQIICTLHHSLLYSFRYLNAFFLQTVLSFHSFLLNMKIRLYCRFAITMNMKLFLFVVWILLCEIVTILQFTMGGNWFLCCLGFYFRLGTYFKT